MFYNIHIIYCIGIDNTVFLLYLCVVVRTKERQQQEIKNRSNHKSRLVFVFMSANIAIFYEKQIK